MLAAEAAITGTGAGDPVHLGRCVAERGPHIVDLDLDAETAQHLREHRKAQLAARLRAGEVWQDDDLIFCQADSQPWNPDHVSKRFKKLAVQADVPSSSCIRADATPATR